LAAAQYGGGMGMGMGMGVGMPGSPTYNPNRSYSSKGAVIGGVVGGAVVGGLLYWHHHHNQAKLQGRVTEDGDKVVSAKENQTYNLANNPNESLTSVQREELLGEKTRNEAGEPTFEVKKLNFEVKKLHKDLSLYTPATAQVQ
jgi:hypothetical protein